MSRVTDISLCSNYPGVWREGGGRSFRGGDNLENASFENMMRVFFVFKKPMFQNRLFDSEYGFEFFLKHPNGLLVDVTNTRYRHDLHD